jgi:transposase
METQQQPEEPEPAGADDQAGSVGIDGRKATLDMAVRPSGAAWQSSTDETGIAAVVDRLQTLAPHVMVVEATGGWERLVAAALALAGLRVAVVNPRQVRDFAKATGRLAKTAAIDAAVLAHCAQALHPTAPPLPDAQSQALAALVERRRPLVTMLTAEKNRLQQALPTGRAKIAAHLAWREEALADVDGELDQRLHASPLWRERDQRLAERTGREAHHLTRLAGASTGVGPRIGQAGSDAGGTGSAQPRQWRLARESRPLGRPAAGACGPLHGPLVGVRYHPVLRVFYERLLARGKPKQVALTACSHTLLTILHALLRDHTPCSVEHAAALA